MSGYAPNPDSSENAAASLTSSLLARKGHAMPAVDAAYHEGVDIDMHPSNAPGAQRRAVDDDAIETIYAPNPGSGPDQARPQPKNARQARHRRGSPNRSGAPLTIEPPPQSWTISTPAPSQPRVAPPAGRQQTARNIQARSGGLRATVTFRMPATDFIRLRHASRNMRETCQTIIVDAIAAYLDANDVELVDEATVMEETARLARHSGRKR